MGIFTKIGITFSYGIKITKFLASWKYCYKVYVMIGYKVYFGFYTIYSSCDLQNGMVRAFGFIL